MDVVLHGHFYQPPRENPWTGAVPRQDSAAPAHDWNERITDECYRPNARSRVLGAGNRIEEIVNNYAFLNFDFGPTLLSWLEVRAPGIYRQILEGDRISVKLQNGHGNAIAHVYNHMIMPLANYRDKRTQIVWGLRDFEWRFGRKSESIWLAETAINLATVKLLVEHGIRFVVLSPFQASRTRPLDRSGGWTEARDGKVDPRRPYRFFVKDRRRRRIPDRYLDVFFYDGALASDVSFNHLLRSAPAFAERIAAAAGGFGDGEGLVSVATDGEVYGHHEPFGDMCLSYVIRRAGQGHDLQLTNYGRFLERHPPQMEVDLNFGEQDEGSAWSCAHGVGRWERDCGCSTGGVPGWNQKWRTPLRRGFDMVRDRTVEVYLEQVSPLVKDPWAARDDYILVLLDRNPAARASFLDQHGRRRLSAAERSRLWALLEAQRYAMFMYTSCGWFFADLSGIETIQNMAYAARAIELARPWQSLDVEKMLEDYLGEAWSNLPVLGHGADIYRRSVRPQRSTAQIVAGDLALTAAVLGKEPASRHFRHDAQTHGFQRREQTLEEGGRLVAYHGWLELHDRATEERSAFAVHVYHSHLADIRAYVLPVAPPEEGEGVGTTDGGRGKAGSTLAPTPAETEVAGQPDVVRLVLSDLIAENRERIIRTAYESILERQDQALAELFGESRDLILTLHSAGVPVPPVFRAVAEHVLARMLTSLAERLEVRLLQELEREGAAPGEPAREVLDEIAQLLRFVEQAELEVSTTPLSQAYGIVLRRLLENLLRTPEPAAAQRCVAVIRSSYDLHFPLDRRPLEDLAFLVLRKHRNMLLEYRQEPPSGSHPDWQAFVALAEALHLNIEWIVALGENHDAADSLDH